MSRPIGFARSHTPVAREIRVESGPYASKTDQTDRPVENQGKFAPPRGRKLTTRHSKLTSGPDQGGPVGASAS